MHFDDRKISQKDTHINHIKFFLLLSEIKLEIDLNEHLITKDEYEILINQYDVRIDNIDKI